ncbi:DUF4111 domain-containing protein [Streptomyces sp. NBC_01236]|nr:DUF4111 domain-containing protein [Streptomyces sp. NBC_01236]
MLTDLRTDTPIVLLTLARIWTTPPTGTIKSKEEAAASWALDRLPAEHRPVLALAQTGYQGTEWEPWDDQVPQVRRHADYVVGVIEQLAAQDG